jgi:hypothetical protein
MKYGLYNLGNFKVMVHKKKCYGFITLNDIEELSTILGHVIISRVMALRSKRFGKFKVCDGFYNSLLCIIKIKIKIKVHHISKRMFFMTIIK